MPKPYHSIEQEIAPNIPRSLNNLEVQRNVAAAESATKHQGPECIPPIRHASRLRSLCAILSHPAEVPGKVSYCKSSVGPSPTHCFGSEDNVLYK